MRRGAVPAPRRISLPAHLRRSRAATQHRAAGQCPSPQKSLPHRRSRARCPRPPARAGREPRRRSGCAASATAPSPPCAVQRLQIARVRRQCLRRRGIGARHARRAERDGRSARRDLLLCHHAARDGSSRRLAQWPHIHRDDPPRGKALIQGKPPRKDRLRHAVPFQRPRGGTQAPHRPQTVVAADAYGKEPHAVQTLLPARRSARPRRAIPLSQTWFPSLPYPTTQKRTLPTLWESPLFPYR